MDFGNIMSFAASVARARGAPISAAIS